jgi:hypothetical protein
VIDCRAAAIPSTGRLPAGEPGAPLGPLACKDARQPGSTSSESVVINER